MPDQKRHPVVNLVVDVTFGGATDVTPEQEAYLKGVRETADKLREQGIPTIWISMSQLSRMHLPEEGAGSGPRDAAQLRPLEFIDHADADKPVTEKNLAVLKAYGPRADEALYQKAFFDSFVMPADVGKLETHLKNHRGKEHAIDVHNAFEGQEHLASYLEKLGTQHVTIMGGNSDVCVMSTAMGAATHGISATVLTDRVISRDDPDATKGAQHHVDKITAKIDKLLHDPAALKDDVTHKAYADGTLLDGREKSAIAEKIDYKTAGEAVAFFTKPTAPEVSGTKFAKASEQKAAAPAVTNNKKLAM